MSGRRRAGARGDDMQRLIAAEREIEKLKRRFLDVPDLTPYTPPYCAAEGTIGWVNYNGYRAPRLTHILDQSGGFSLVFPVPDAFLDTVDGHASWVALQAPEPGLYRTTIMVDSFQVRSAVDTPRLWYLPFWFPAETQAFDAAGSAVDPPGGPTDDWTRYWASSLVAAGGELGNPVLMDNSGTVDGSGNHIYGSAGSAFTNVLEWSFIAGVGPEWGDYFGDHSAGSHNILGIFEYRSTKMEMDGTAVLSTVDLASPSGVGPDPITPQGSTRLLVEKIGDRGIAPVGG